MFITFVFSGEKASDLEIARDLSLLAHHLGMIEAAHRVKWADFCSHINTSDNKKTFRLFTLLRNNTVHGLLVDVDFKKNVLQAETVANLDHVSVTIQVNYKLFFREVTEPTCELWQLLQIMPPLSLAPLNLLFYGTCLL